MNLQLVYRYILSLSKNKHIFYEKTKKKPKGQKKEEKKFLQRESNPGTFDTVGLRVFRQINQL